MAKLARPKRPGFHPYDKNGNIDFSRMTTKKDWDKYYKALEKYENKRKK